MSQAGVIEGSVIALHNEGNCSEKNEQSDCDITKTAICSEILCSKRRLWRYYIAQIMLDEIDLHILEVLQRDGRISNQDLADAVGLSPSPCLRRMRQLESSGVIQKYVALVSPAEVGHGLQAFVEVRLDRQTRASVDKFEAEIVKLPQVLECYLMAGDWDYLLRVVVPDLDALRDFHMNHLGKIQGVGNVKSNISMKLVKYSTALPLGKKIRHA